jgi:hypothetical protein
MRPHHGPSLGPPAGLAEVAVIQVLIFHKNLLRINPMAFEFAKVPESQKLMLVRELELLFGLY